MFPSIQIPRIQGRRALLVINCQVSAFNDHGEQMAANPPDFLDRICRIIPYYRKLGTQIVWVQTVVPEHDSDRDKPDSPTYDLADYLPSSKAESERTKLSEEAKARKNEAERIKWDIKGKRPTFKRLKHGNDIVKELSGMVDKEKDLIIEKKYYSAFDETGLLMSLRVRMVTEAHICGGLSNVSIINTAAEAARHGFEVSVVEDCLGYRSEDLHLEAMKKMADEVGVSGVDTEEIITESGGRAPPDADPDIFSGPGFSGINISPASVPANHNADEYYQPLEAESSSQTRPRKTPIPPMSLEGVLGADGALADGVNGKAKRSNIGEGDSRVITKALSPALAAMAFGKLKAEVDWQAMKHRTGDVPRRVAVQGEIGPDGSVPIYRHPADESPPLISFSPTVRHIRDEVETLCGQSFNHVLVQLYRDGQDNISEHADKTLDIVRESDIINVSLGAQRKMTLRVKKSVTSQAPPSPSVSEQQSKTSGRRRGNQSASLRESQRVVLPDNSVFVLGWRTNQRWLHGIRPDKRPEHERSVPELAFDGERISLTFRNIGTFTDADRTCIWGQGARAKTREDAHKILTAGSGEAENMLIAFGSENHKADFDWDKEYGSGFDALDLVVVNRPAEEQQAANKQGSELKQC